MRGTVKTFGQAGPIIATSQAGGDGLLVRDAWIRFRRYQAIDGAAMRSTRWLIACLAMNVIVAGAAAQAGVMIYGSSGTFLVPTGVTSVNVLAIGGGGGGANGHQGGGGAGFLSIGTFAVTQGDLISIVVGTGGSGALTDPTGNEIVGLTAGTASSFGGLLTANGGQVVAGINQGGQNGSSGGGGSGNPGPGGAGGSGGSNGLPGNQPFGFGQGDYTAALGLFTESVLSPGAGGAAGVSSHSGGGGGGGILINGVGPNAGNGLAVFSAKGGAGYGAGGGAGGYDSSSFVRPGGGNGADGLVYIEWRSAAAAVPEPSTVASLGIAGLIGLAARFRRRLRLLA